MKLVNQQTSIRLPPVTRETRVTQLRGLLLKALPHLPAGLQLEIRDALEPNVESVEDAKATFADLIAIMVRSRSFREGSVIPEMRKRTRILKECEADKDILDFASSEVVFIKDLCDKHQWGLDSEEIIAVADSIEAADGPAKEKATEPPKAPVESEPETAAPAAPAEG